jgi:radical SAM protein with 4Fe4S-binding SPASM domain
LRGRERWEYLARAGKIAWDAMLRGRYSFTYDWMPITVRGMSFAQRSNLLRAGMNLLYRRARPWSWPLNMQIELTSYCNLRCPVCPVGTKELSRGSVAIDLRMFEGLMQEVGPYLLTLSLWAWGEPLLHPKLAEILSITRRYPVATLLSTNGQNLNQERVLTAIQEAPPTYLIVAVDGLCDETNALYRKGARLAPILEGVRALAAWKRQTRSNLPVLHCRFLVMKHNEHELTGLRQFGEDNGFDMMSLRGLSIIDSAEEAHRALVPDAEQWRAYKYVDGKRVNRDDFICQHAFSFPTVLADGTVVACEQDFNGTQAYGAFSAERSLRTIWFSSKAAAVRRLIRKNPNQFSFCSNCPYADRPISSCSLHAYPLHSIQV